MVTDRTTLRTTLRENFPRDHGQLLPALHYLQHEFGYLPASKVEVKDPKYPEIYAVFEESMKYARNRGPHPQWPRISKAIQTAIQSTLTGQATPEDALAAAQTSIDKVLK